MRETVNRSLTIFVLCLASLVWTVSCRSIAQTTSLATMKLHFPQPWHDADERPVDHVEQIEVRTLSSSPGEYFFAAIPHSFDYYPDESSSTGRRLVTSENSYAVKLTPDPRVRAATKQEWKSATPIVTKSRQVHWNNSNPYSGVIEYRGKKFQKTGKYWQSAGVSPAGRWLAVFSYTGERTRDFAFMDGGSVKSGDIFWDLYDTVTGEKVFQWRASNVKNPTVFGGPVVWLDERYFLFPEDEDDQHFTVVTLPEFIAETNPVQIALPSRMDANGTRVPAPANHPVWRPLPLTEEYEARITAEQGPHLIEVRAPRNSSSRELFLAIREVTETGVRHQAARGREPARNYNYRVFSTYYYALSVDNPTQSRFATKEEWESAQVLTIKRLQSSPDKAVEPIADQRQEQRPFPKAGASLGGSLQSDSGNWTAVFSYTQHAAADKQGKMFVEIFETRPRDKFSSTELPYTGSAPALFAGAMWIQGDYLLVPLNISLDSFALWRLPGGTG